MTTSPTCQHCGVRVLSRERGRPIQFCSDRCRKAAKRTGYLRTKKLTLIVDSGPPKLSKNSKQEQGVICPKIGFSENEPLRFEQVNEVTWKLTSGSGADVPASRGQWGGYRTTKALAWVINVGPGVWAARCRDMASEPLPLTRAKTAAQRMVVAGLHDHRVTCPVDHLNQMALRGGDPNKTETAKVPILPCSLRGAVVDLVGIDPKLLAATVEIECHPDRNEVEAAA
jgi:hypothetical protein